MSDITLDRVFHLAEQLSPQEQTALIQKLQNNLLPSAPARITREMLLAEQAQLRASGAFERTVSLEGKYARPDLDLSFERLDADIREINRQWEDEIDEFFGER